MIAALIALFYFKGVRQAPPSAPTATNEVSPADSGTDNSTNVTIPAKTASSNAVVYTTQAQQSPPKQVPPVSQMLSSYNDQPIVFWGKIEDQFSNAVPEATVYFGVRVMNGTESTVKKGQVVSDANGLFSISGYTGQDLGMGVQKPGYTFLSMGGSGIYSKIWPEDQRASPDPSNPTIIKMWKLQGGEHLIHFEFRSRIPSDGTPVTFDFGTGTIVTSGGDMTIQIQSPAAPDTSHKYDWQLTILPVEGGILPDNNPTELQFQAPEFGYARMFNIVNKSGVRPWASDFHGGFYFKSRDGNAYGKFDLGAIVYATRDGLVPITIDGYINPSGSRNLEIDSQLETEAHP